MSVRREKWRPAKLDDGSKVDAFKLLKILSAARDDLLAAEQLEAAHYFEMVVTWLQIDIFQDNKPFEYSCRVLNL